MSSSYYYFVATLPTLAFNGSSPLTVEEFRIDCERLLKKEDYEDVERALGLRNGAPFNPLLAQWQRFVHELQAEIAWHRLSHQGAGAALNFERGFDSEVVDIVNQAFKEGDLLTAEKMVMRLQWDRLEHMSLNHFFDLECILIYAAKLKILERLSVFASQEGRQIFEAIEVNVLKMKDEKIRTFK
ncbi:MAG TPA: DUF2764 family protein [Candidatus Omnitrophota bacterium]|jgi:hypothetical protein|nr:DUF2764 family protein [Candidatus Omnitrophota bacterium]HSA30655.1 DUF2764 family protein [Candidatus Omnitrophota bacterium]